jgi:hypothetical protein
MSFEQPASGRWSARRKAELVRALGAGTVTAQQLQAEIAMSSEELDSLVRAYGRAGEDGLKLKHLQDGR